MVFFFFCRFLLGVVNCRMQLWAFDFWSRGLWSLSESACDWWPNKSGVGSWYWFGPFCAVCNLINSVDPIPVNVDQFTGKNKKIKRTHPCTLPEQESHHIYRKKGGKNFD